ncbi:hypothetical protein N5I87_06115 [Ralstonia sp. CHL-2022]|uniref:Uncharacterized protein n=1 Tax=Ralstonia mojiangensis TaxID=2953895 RepID=A0AAE3LBJ1_9RALS|nr:hypothetical protein [Ralstonia mojiangensis]MCT7315572.1 hypothetical protein [Ralstonia mojiangensis]
MDQIKRRFSIPTSTVLHCRTLFNGRQREKMGLSHLDPGDVRAIIAQAITAINEVRGRVHYAVQNFTAFAKQLGSELHFHSNDGTPSVTLPVSVEPKGLLGMLAIACFPLGQFHVNGPSAAQCEIFVSEDRTKISFLGERRTRADSLYAGFLDTGTALMQLNAHVVAADADPLLQLADIAAYVCSHAAALGSEDGFWREQLARVIHWYKVG